MHSTKQVDILIVGQGIAGTMMAYRLIQRGVKVHVIDDGHATSSSLAAAGIVNPITGRKYVKSWRAEDFIPVARTAYNDISNFLEQSIARDVYIYRALYSAEDENTFLSRASDEKASQFIHTDHHNVEYDGLVEGVLSYGVVKGGMQVNLPLLLESFREYLISRDSYTQEIFDYSQMDISNGDIRYKGIQADKVIFAEGYRGQYNPYFQDDISYEPVKGEALIVKFPQHSFENILRHKIFIAPIGSGRYWVGSGYEWEFADNMPSDRGGTDLKDKLDSMLSIPYDVVDHVAGVRPSVKGRKPRLGRHPQYTNIYCFNGMGTKGTSLSPYWSEQMASFVLDNKELDIEVDIYS